MAHLPAGAGTVELFSGTGALQWSGKPLQDAKVVLPIEGTTDAIVLIDWGAFRGGSFQNLLRVRANGSVVWRAALPTGQVNGDAYVAVRWGPEAQLIANTWSTNLVRLDLESGRILDSIFTK